MPGGLVNVVDYGSDDAHGRRVRPLERESRGVVAALGFLGQPGSDESTLAAFLERALAAPQIDSLTVVVAWVRFRGLVRLQCELEAFRDRGGCLKLITGIDEGGATRPGLLLAARLFHEAYVFHDPAGGTFHPKMYLAEGARQAQLVVGSSNATPGGWYQNYETSLEAHFALPAEAHHPALEGVRAYIDSLLAERELCFSITEELVDRLVREPPFNVAGHERPRRQGTGAQGDPDVDASGSTEEAPGAGRIFGARRGGRTFAPPLSREATDALAALEIPPDDEAEPDEVSSPPAQGRPQSGPTAVAVASWRKVLPRGDAQQQTGASTNVTANVRLTKQGHEIDATTWFRQELFGPAAWHSDTDINGNPIERAEVPFVVTIDGVPLGTVVLEVTHGPHRESDQHNHTTVLRWGQLQSTMRSTDYTGRTLTLERLSDDTYRLDIS